MPQYPKLKGEVAEARFLADALALDLIVAKPWGDSLPFDFLVGRNPRFYRVQIKSTARRHCRGYHVSCFRPSDGQPYTEDDIDYLAALVIPERTWYLIPVRALARRKTIVLFPGRPPARGRFEPYREAWHRLTVHPQE